MIRPASFRFSPLLFVILAAGVAGCTASRTTAPTDAEASVWTVSDDLRVERLRPGVWMHTSWQVLAGGTRFPSNGLIVQDGDGLVLIDTAWGVGLTEQLLGWVDETIGRPVGRAIITHFHADRMGGTPVLAARGIPFMAHPLTRSLGAEEGVPLPDPMAGLFVGGAVAVGPVEVFYPGPGHTRDNLVVWVPSAGVLFGGCAVRPAGTTSLGNTTDADVRAWPVAIGRVQARYPSAVVVVPSHGPPGDAALLAHTRSLFEDTEK